MYPVFVGTRYFLNKPGIVPNVCDTKFVSQYTCANDAHRNYRGHRNRIRRILGFLARGGDAVEADVRVETGGCPGDDTSRAIRHEPAVTGPIVAVSVIISSHDDYSHYAKVDQRQEAIHVRRSFHANPCTDKTIRYYTITTIEVIPCNWDSTPQWRK